MIKSPIINFPSKFKWGQNAPKWSSVFVSSDDEIENLNDVDKFLNNFHKRNLSLASVIGGMKFLKIYCKYNFNKLFLFDENINEIAKMDIFFNYIHRTNYKDFKSNHFLEEYINKNFSKFYLNEYMQKFQVKFPKNFHIRHPKKKKIKEKLTMVFRPSIYKDLILKFSEAEFNCIKGNLKNSWPEYSFDIPNIDTNDKFIVVYNSHIPWPQTEKILSIYDLNIFTNLKNCIFGFYKFVKRQNIKFLMKPLKKDKLFKNLLKKVFFIAVADRLWKAEQKIYKNIKNKNKLIIHDTRKKFNLEKNQYNLDIAKNIFSAWDFWVSAIVKLTNNNNGLQIWSHKNILLSKDKKLNFFVKKNLTLSVFMKSKPQIKNYNFIIFHNLFSSGENLKDIAKIFDQIPLSIKIIISESIISSKVQSVDKIIKKISGRRELNQITFSGGTELKKRNKFYIFNKSQ